MKKKIICFGLVMFMLFSLSACADISDTDETESGFLEVEADAMVDTSLFWYTPIRSWAGYPITVWHEDESAVFECAADKGAFSWIEEKASIAVNSGEGFHWWPIKRGLTEQVFVDIVVKIGDNIVGYAVLEMYLYQEFSSYDFKARVLKSALIPKVDGEYQNITKEQIKTAIDKIKES